jgi:hypothetical protein
MIKIFSKRVLQGPELWGAWVYLAPHKWPGHSSFVRATSLKLMLDTTMHVNLASLHYGILWCKLLARVNVHGATMRFYCCCNWSDAARVHHQYRGGSIDVTQNEKHVSTMCLASWFIWVAHSNGCAFIIVHVVENKLRTFKCTLVNFSLSNAVW